MRTSNNVTAVYAGSFDPFTNGHLDVLIKASKCFSKVIVLLANNAKKKRMYDIHIEKEVIETVLRENMLFNCVVDSMDSLVVDYCRSQGATVLVRGIRNFQDFGDEENIASLNKKLAPEIETIYFRASDSCNSSSIVKELYRMNKDVSAFVPAPVLTMMKVMSEKGDC